MKLPAKFIEALLGAAEDVGADLLTIDADANHVYLVAGLIRPKDTSRTDVLMTIRIEGPITVGAYNLTMVRAHAAACLNNQLGARESWTGR